jgi:cytochrome c
VRVAPEHAAWNKGEAASVNAPNGMPVMTTNVSRANNVFSWTIGVQACTRTQFATIVALVAVLVNPCSREALAAGDPIRGEQVYEGCTDCHSPDENSVGPKHRDVFGSKAGAVRDYHYSEALKSSGIVWNEETLDKWLTDSQVLVPGNKMFFRVPDAQARADIIAYLKKLKIDHASAATSPPHP